MGVTVTNVKIVQCTIFRWNPWTTNWINRVWNRGAANFETQCKSLFGQWLAKSFKKNSKMKKAKSKNGEASKVVKEPFFIHWLLITYH